jgi:hypothetical protein
MEVCMIMNDGYQKMQIPNYIENMLKNGLDVTPEEQEKLISRSTECDGLNYFASLT